MCGIAGVFRLTGRPGDGDARAVVRMLDAQIHRGPDDWGLLLPRSLAHVGAAAVPGGASAAEHVRTYPDEGGPGVVLGARRLSIIDLSTRGRMPMDDGDARRWIVPNGEVYNHREVRADLGGAAFASHTDTETVLRGYAAWGDAVVPRLS